VPDLSGGPNQGAEHLLSQQGKLALNLFHFICLLFMVKSIFGLSLSLSIGLFSITIDKFLVLFCRCINGKHGSRITFGLTLLKKKLNTAIVQN